MRNKFVILSLALVVGALSIAAAAAGQLSSDPPERQALTSAKSLDVFSTGEVPEPSTIKAIADLVDSSADADPLLAAADVDLARGTATADGKYTVWSLPTPDGGICVLIPSVGGGFGAGCSTIEEFNDVGNVGVGLAAPGVLVAAVAQPPGAQSTVTDDNSSKGVDTTSGVAAIVLGTGETLRSGRSTYAADDLLGQADAVRADLAKQVAAEK